MSSQPMTNDQSTAPPAELPESASITLLKELWKQDLAPKDIIIIEHIHRNGPTTLTGISKMLELKNSYTATLGADTLERKGLAVRKPKPGDRRSVLIHLTPKATSLIKKLNLNQKQPS